MVSGLRVSQQNENPSVRWFLLVLETGFKGNKRMAFTSYRAEGALRPRLGVG